MFNAVNNSQLLTLGIQDGVILRGIASHEKAGKPSSEQVRHAASAEFAMAGFLIDPDNLLGMGTGEVAQCLEAAREVTGSNRCYRTLFPGFPEKVAATDTATLVIHQIIHYFSYGTWGVMGDTHRWDNEDISVILSNARHLGVKDVREYAQETFLKYSRLTRALSDVELRRMELLAEYLPLSNDDTVEALVSMNHRENMVNIAIFIINARAKGDNDADAMVSLLIERVHHIDTVLRLILARYGREETRGRYSGDGFDLAVYHLSDRDASSVRMAFIPHGVRRGIVNAVVRCTGNGGAFRYDLLMARKRLWARVFNAIHAKSLARSSTAWQEAVDVVYDNVPYRTMNSVVKSHMDNGDAIKAVDAYLEARAFSLLVRNAVALTRVASTKKDAQYVASSIEEASKSHRIPLSTLISAYNGVMVNGTGLGSTVTISGHGNIHRESKELPAERKSALLDAISAAMVNQLSKVEAELPDVIGVDDDTPVSISAREASLGDRNMEKGERVSLPEDGDAIRLFTHWRNGNYAYVDLDLGVTLVDADFSQSRVITWDNSYYDSSRALAVYSGDITSAPGEKGASEFIDVNIDNAVNHGYRYAIHSVYSYSGQKMCSVDHISGAMIRSGVGDKGDVFDGRTVSTAFTSTADARGIAGFAIDLETRELIWLDINSSGFVGAYSSATSGELLPRIKAEMLAPKLTRGQLMRLLAASHGVPVSDEPVDRELLDNVMHITR